MLTETYNFLLTRTGHHPIQDAIAEEPISLQENLGICLYRLSRGDHVHAIAEITEPGLKTVEFITQDYQ